MGLLIPLPPVGPMMWYTQNRWLNYHCSRSKNCYILGLNIIYFLTDPYGMVHANISSSRIIEIIEIWCDYAWLHWLTLLGLRSDDGRLPPHPNPPLDHMMVNGCDVSSSSFSNWHIPPQNPLRPFEWNIMKFMVIHGMMFRCSLGITESELLW